MGEADRASLIRKIEAAHDRCDTHAKVIEQYHKDLTAHRQEIMALRGANAELRERLAGLREEFDTLSTRLATPWYRKIQRRSRAEG